MRFTAMMMAVALSMMMLIAPTAGAAPDGPDGLPEPTTLGRAVVQFHAGFLPDVGHHASFQGLPVLDAHARGSFLVLGADDLRDVREALASTPGIKTIEDDSEVIAAAVPNDARYNLQYGPDMMGAHTAWDQAGWGGEGITVAVLDTGIRAGHQDLQGSRFLAGYDYSDDDPTPNDVCGHGTHVIGTVAATTNNGVGVAGMAQANILPMKVLDDNGNPAGCSGANSDIAAAIYDAADQGAHIISMSLGGPTSSSVTRDAVDYAWSAGAIVVAAAGNDGPCFVGCVGYPAGYDNAIAVAALDPDKGKALYSSSGSQVEIAAPGTDVESTYHSSNSAYRSMDGTSMATPHVAGALALAWACDTGLTNAQLRTLMQGSAEDLGSNGRDSSYGYGLLRIDSLLADMGGCGETPNVAPTATLSDACTNLACAFDGTASTDSDGTIASYAWTFGDGNTGNGATPSHTYANAGTYTVTLTVTDNDGATDSASTSITVTSPPPSNEAPSAAFTDACTFLACSFDGSASTDTDGTIASYAWTFGDGNAGSGATPSHTYANAGTYTVTLTVTDNDGATDSASTSVTVAAQSGGGGTGFLDDMESATGWTQSSAGGTAVWSYTTARSVSPSTSLALRNYGGSENDALTSPPIDLSGLSDATLTLASWMQGEEYCFFSCTIYDYGTIQVSGDGGTSWRTLATNYFASSGWETLTYNLDAEAGSGDVRLRFTFVSDSQAHYEGWYLDDVEVTGTTTAPNAPPTAAFAESCNYLACSFNGDQSSDSDGSIASYAWTFGDGNTATGANPSHTYANAGTYTVTLTVTDNDGATDSTSAQVTVAEAPNQAPSAALTDACTYLVCSFDGSGSSDGDGSIASYAWTLGDGNTATGANPSHTYASAGTYTVTLTVTDNDGATDSASTSVTVAAEPEGCSGGDPNVPELQNGQSDTATVASGGWAYRKICVPAGQSVLDVVMDGPACSGFLTCSPDIDLYVRAGALPTTSTYDCNSAAYTNDESCGVTNPTDGWWYIGMDSYSGGATVSITATYS